MRFLFSISFVLLFSVVAFSQNSPVPSQVESWNEIQFIVPLKQGKDAKEKTIDKVTATFNGVTRIGRRSVDFLDNRVGAALDFRVNHFFTVNTATFYRRDEFVKNVYHYETRLIAGGTLSDTFHKLTLRSRTAYEHRFRNSRADLNVFRQRFQAIYPLKYHGKELFSPFVTEEGFYDLRAKNWFRNEFYVGVSRHLNPQTTLDIAFIHNDTRPVNVNGLNLVLKIRLK